ncbi:MAG TPA: hypothetical protein VHB74_00635 [Devosia sp.]|nr:hypothetical protein [Devosia sp.]
MILFVTLLALGSLMTFIVTVIWFKRMTPLVLPALFVALFWGSVSLVAYVGYAVDSRYLDGTEATVIDSVDGSQWIYLLVKLDKDNEPRLVRLPNTEQNKKGADQAKQQAQKGLAVIRFGDGPQNASAGANQDGQSQDSPTSFRILNLAETNVYGKTGGATD